MYRKKTNIQKLAVLWLDCICIAAGLVSANYIRNGRPFGSDNERMNFGLLLGVCMAVYFAEKLFLTDRKHDFFRRRPLQELVLVLKDNLIILSGTAIILFFLGVLDAYSRLMFLFFVLVNCIFMFTAHQIWKKSIPFITRRFGETRNLLLVCDKNHVQDWIRELEKIGDFEYELKKVLLLDKADALQKSDRIQVIPDGERIVRYCMEASVDEVIIAIDAQKEKKIFNVMETLATMGLAVHYLIEMPELEEAGQKTFSRFGKFYTATYASRIVPAGQVFLKRLLDLCGSIAGCAILVPLTVVLGPLIKLDSPGPVFFSQERVGRNGRIFRMYKFRSMYVDAEERKKELAEYNEIEGLMFKMENDPRITRAGHFLRKTSLDEFPQFINILKGDMSLVGTRPPTLDEYARYSPYHKRRLSFRPGLTGMWQVSGRSDITDFEEIVRLDVKYIDEWSIFLDLKILVRTFAAVVWGKGAR